MRPANDELANLTEFIGGMAPLVMFTVTHTHLAIEVKARNENKSVYLLLDGCLRIEAPIAWHFNLPKLTRGADGLIAIEDAKNRVRLICESFRIRDDYEIPFAPRKQD